jgi:hypothetical protein
MESEKEKTNLIEKENVKTPREVMVTVLDPGGGRVVGVFLFETRVNVQVRH